VSCQLDGAIEADAMAADNDDAAYWCASTTSVTEADDMGTPGAANLICAEPDDG